MVTSGRNEINGGDAGALLRRALATAALAAAAFGSTAARAEAPTTCDGTISTGTYDALIVPSFTACVVESFGGVTVLGNVLVQEGGSLSVGGNELLSVGGNVSLATGASLSAGPNGLAVAGSVVAQQPTAMDLIDFSVGHDITIHGGGAQGIRLIDHGRIGGNVSIIGANAPTAAVTIDGLIIGGQLSILNNHVSVVSITNNTIGGNVTCIGNTDVTFSGNTVGGRVVGQCE